MQLVQRLKQEPALDKLAEPLSDAVKGAYEAAGPVGQKLKNAMHGVWLSHPLHPVLTDIPVGAWTTGLVLDAIASRSGDEGMKRAADVAIAVGLCGAAGAAVTGLTDWSETDGGSRRTGLVHGLLNITATTLFAAAYALRKNGSRSTARTCAIAGYSIALGAAYLGGDLVYGQRVGVTHAVIDQPHDFKTVGKSSDLQDNTMKRMVADQADVLLVRQHGRVCALAHPCAHMGGPLSEGTLKDGSVVCPWHGSEFDIDSGEVLNGPATQDQPTLDVRERDGVVEVRAK